LPRNTTLTIEATTAANSISMKTCLELRLENARALAGNGPAEFARKVNITGQQANQMIGPNPTRGIGHEKAREIERAHGREVGWLDHDHSQNEELDTPAGWGALTEIERARVEGFISGLLAVRSSDPRQQQSPDDATPETAQNRRGSCKQ